MIVKAQRSLYSSDGKASVLIYDRDRTVIEVHPLTEDLDRKLGESNRRFFHATVHNGRLRLGSIAPTPDW